MDQMENMFLKGFELGVRFKDSEYKSRIEIMKKYIKACWYEEKINDYCNYRTDTSDEFKDLVKELMND